MQEVYIVYSKSKIHGVYTNEFRARQVLDFLTEKGGYVSGVPKRFYFLTNVELDKLPNGLNL